MPYYILSYEATIDAKETLLGVVGRSTIDLDCIINETKRAIKERFGLLFPNAVTIDVTIVENKKVTSDAYHDFIVAAQFQRIQFYL